MISTKDIARRTTVRLAAMPLQTPYVDTAAGCAEWTEAAASAELQPCEWCGEVGHVVLTRAAPRPDPTRTDTLDELVEACSCCMFGPVGHPQRGLLARLRSEQANGDDHDLTVEVLAPDGRWIS